MVINPNSDMNMRNSIEQVLRNMALLGFYAAGFGLVFSFGIFAMSCILERNSSVEVSDEVLQEKILTTYDIESEETTPSSSQNKTRSI